MIEALMTYGILALAISYVASQAFAVWALARFHRKRSSLAQTESSVPFYPGISVVTSLKGPTPGATESVRSLLRQDYPGDLEIVFAVKDASEPLLAEVCAVCAETPSRASIRWVYPVSVDGLNPRTAKIARAVDESSLPWIFGTTVDTRFAPGFLRRAMDLGRADPSTYVTSFPVIDRPRDFAAILEAVGLNVDVSQYFLFTSMSGGACAYGGAMLFSRELLNRAGGYGPILRSLTDDVTMAHAFKAAGATCLLSSDFVYVRQERHLFRTFWDRQVRWRMIGRYFLPSLFWLAPLSWSHVYLAIGAAVMRSWPFAIGLVGVTLSRVAIGYGVQTLLETPRADRAKAWALPFYDWIATAAWIAAVAKRSVRWGSTVMRLDAGGFVTKTTAVRAVDAHLDSVGRPTTQRLQADA